MRINCPICGDRDRQEFYYLGASDYLNRPAEGDLDGIHKYLHIRENPAGVTKDLWHHEAGCSSWLVVERNTSTHEILGVELASEVAK
ncbi:sarcosine oxidase subunit delta [Litoreibacter halocynthiae]|uniref:sarcosine oxidase subunit delta n=1 Tax=Litoreibacter halocynthiae TaxID=1242689 RepID=UPI002490AAC9|nr:sarcosine oxidase subunit delta [Litoreibacter halocynthiae]